MKAQKDEVRPIPPTPQPKGANKPPTDYISVAANQPPRPVKTGRPSGIAYRGDDLPLPPFADREGVLRGLAHVIAHPPAAVEALAKVEELRARDAQLAADLARVADWDGDGVPDDPGEVGARVAAINNERAIVQARVGQALDGAIRTQYRAILATLAEHEALAADAAAEVSAAWDTLAVAAASPELYAHGVKWLRDAIEHGACDKRSFPAAVIVAKGKLAAARRVVDSCRTVAHRLIRGDFTAIR